jgi:hypothetical protein
MPRAPFGTGIAKLPVIEPFQGVRVNTVGGALPTRA